jgi:PAS domain S-box-containing protein
MSEQPAPDASAAPAPRVFRLSPVPESAREARRLVIAELAPLHVSEDVVDTARLLVSELVTNVVLHARTDMELSVQASAAVLRIGVSDGSRRVPTSRHYAATAATGRGMSLVAELSTDHGTEVTADGKIVWVTLNLRPGHSVAPATPASPTTTTALPSASATPPLTVLFARAPTVLYRAFAQQAEGLLREYLLAEYGGDNDAGHTARLGVAAGALGLLTDAVDLAISEQASGGRDVEVTLAVPPSSVDDFAVLQAVLAEAVTMADAGALLAPPSQPEIVALGDWFCRQVADQSRGNAPRPWLRPGGGRVPTRPQPDWDPAGVLNADIAIVAADDANRILAISRPVTDLLGWTAPELIGERIVVLIPDELREAHIAGFTRYLVTGEVHILGTPVPVPALHRDGHQVPITVLVREQVLPRGRRMFIAELREVVAPA